SNFEVIVIDDNSCDDTGKVVEQFIERRQQCNFKLLSHRNDGMKPTYKKTAISYAMQYARGEIILTTDADCLVQPKWVASMVSRFDEQTGLVAGLVTFYTRNGNRLFHQLQTLEFAGLVFAGVGAIGNHYPLICNASNLSYRRKAYDDVGGFDGHEEVPSGDDDLFMQNIHHHTNWRVRYNLNPEAVNSTHPVDTLAQFFNQRARWASKSTHYPGVATFTLLFLIYLFYLLLVVLTIAAIASQFSVSVLVIGL
ncbi:MAG: glycosyltransferase, partial [Gammaproteobacteria bacterium]|nr:glycosyltransferase [Gammaproteobacteria bacterium]NIT52989.1 glycosyltransferase [candidate division Zixibacteria bacterium]NIW47031.1 glycosyltransferase [Gammaproteobacteria bacterium]NIX58014.1 glycosyltransferase [candidate division Zixibacteria bacterium]